MLGIMTFTTLNKAVDAIESNNTVADTRRLVPLNMNRWRCMIHPSYCLENDC